ncbi:hypothetical protein CPC08DRAFT_624942 [Agrocybe pediades]|nr:hypothetical protein CPC08DRAFT_624942 [Agrocybe pediades]
MACSPSSFYRSELQRALKEQTFGIQSYALTSSCQEQATATIVLHEGSKVNVQLNIQGYSIVSNGTVGKVYETIEDLLHSISPMYAKKRQEELFTKLSKLS